MGIRDKDIPRKMRDFLWKMMHGAQRLGNYWEHIPGYEYRATCSVCGMEDTMEHILFECEAQGQAVVWRMVRKAIELTGCTVPNLSIGAVLGASSIALRRQGVLKKGPSRLAKLLVVEGAHLIWRLRCERVIEWEDSPEKSRTASEVMARFRMAVSRRMEVDRSLMCSWLTGAKPKRAIVLETWRRVLANWKDLPQDWIESPGVLVGTLGQPHLRGVG